MQTHLVRNTLILGLLTIGLWACGQDPTGSAPNRIEPIFDLRRPPLTAAEAREVCVPLVGRPRPGTILVPVPGKRPRLLDCADVPAATVRATVRAQYEEIARTEVPGRSALMAGHISWSYAGSTYECDEPTQGHTTYFGGELGLMILNTDDEGNQYPVVYVPPGGTYVHYWDMLPVCEWLDHFTGTLIPGDGDGGGGEGGDGGGGGGGGGGNGGGGEGGGESWPDVDLSIEAEDRLVLGDTINCGLTQVNEAAAQYCVSSRLSRKDALYMSRLQLANERMRARGGLCATKAAIVDSLIARDAIRTSNTPRYSGWAPIGFRGMGGVLLHERYFINHYDAATRGVIKGKNGHPNTEVASI